MTGDGTNGDRARTDAGRRDEDGLKQSMADLSRRLGERAARQGTVDPEAAKAARQAALQEYDRLRERRMIVALGVVLAAMIGSGTAYFAWTVSTRSGPSSSAAAPPVEPERPLTMARIVPAAAPAPPESPAVEPLPPSPPSPSQAASLPDPPPVEQAPVPLRSDEVKEIQARLRSFGFDPGPVDGNAGRLTSGAVQRYQKARNQPQSGAIDRALLDQLRQDPAPRRTAKPNSRGTGANRPRSSDPFASLQAAGDRLGRWMDAQAR